MAEKEIPEEQNQGDTIDQDGSFGVGNNQGNIHAQNVAGTVNVYNQTNSPESHLTPQQYRNRQALLTKVNNFWVKGLLEKSLHNQVLIELGLEERPDAITNSWNAILETGENSPQPIPQGTKIIDVFDDIGAGRTLLILGEPGSGKTTTLLELTRDLIARAQQDTKQLIPVVFNLSSWANKRQKIEDWLTEELGNKYDVPKKIRESLVKEQQLLPLLDGLDEVKAEYRDDCLVAINQFKQKYGSELVVCSRIKDYQTLSNRLEFQSAICIKLLGREQICNYLDSLGANLIGLKTLIAEDKIWQGLAESPLILNIMALAYQGIAIEDLPKTDSLEERRKQLFNAYIEQAFKRRKANQLYTNKQVIHWLVWLAKKMVQESQTILHKSQNILLIENIQPTWLHTKRQRIIWLIGKLIIISIISWLTFIPVFGKIAGLIVGLIIAITFSFSQKIVTFELTISKAKIKEGLIGGIVLGLIQLLIVAWLGYPLIGFIYDLLFTLCIILCIILGSTLSDGGLSIITNSPDREIKIAPAPNQGIWNSAISAGIVGIITAIATAPLVLLIAILTFKIGFRLTTGIICVLAVISILNRGGKACIQHFSLRLVLHHHNYIPWNYARFLDYAADRILLQKVGGGYIFIHRMLMEHFAEMSLD